VIHAIAVKIGRLKRCVGKVYKKIASTGEGTRRAR
jgi:hypothetical protein